MKGEREAQEHDPGIYSAEWTREDAIRDRWELATAGPWEVYNQAEDEGWDYPSCAVRSLGDTDADWVAEIIHTNEDADAVAHAREDVPWLLSCLASERSRADRLAEAILDIDAHAKPLGEDEDGFVAGGYTISVGSLHRALGLVGHTAPPCSDKWPCSVAADAGSRADRLEQDLERVREGLAALHVAYTPSGYTVPLCAECDRSGGSQVVWPCPTIRVLTAALTPEVEPK